MVISLPYFKECPSAFSSRIVVCQGLPCGRQSRWRTFQGTLPRWPWFSSEGSPPYSAFAKVRHPYIFHWQECFPPSFCLWSENCSLHDLTLGKKNRVLLLFFNKLCKFFRISFHFLSYTLRFDNYYKKKFFAFIVKNLTKRHWLF